MERKSKTLIYLSCMCCEKTFSLDDLIETSSNALVIGKQTIEISEMLLELFIFKTDSTKESHICFDCKDYLVQFHTFKKNIKKYKSFEKVLKSSKLFVILEPILDELETDNLKVEKYRQNEVFIATSEEHKLFQSFQPNVVVEALQEEIPEVLPPEACNKRKIETPTPPQGKKIEEKITKDIKVKSNFEIEVPMWTNKEQTQMMRWNTNSSITEEQKTWIWEDARKSETKQDGKTIWRCSICSSDMSSFWVLRKHLRDVHIIKPTKESNKKRRGKDFMEEVRSCKKLGESDEETYWQCVRCDKVHKSESGFIKHLLYQHINDATIDPTFIARCKISVEFEDASKESEVGWGCPECKKFFKSAVGLKNHLKLSHANIDFGGEMYQRKIQEIAERSMIIKEEEKQSEIILETENGPKKIWECKRCIEPRFFRSENGFKTHLRVLHLMTRNIDDAKVAQCRTVSEDSGAKLKVWKCSICSVTTRTKEGFVSHVSQEHPGEFEEKEEAKNKVVQLPARDVKEDEVTLQKLAVQVANVRGGALKVDGYKFSCNDCGLFFSKHYPTHFSAHETIRQLTHCCQVPTCQQCRVKYSNEDAMVKHLEWHIEESEILPAYPSSGLACFSGKEFKPPTGSADDAVDESTWKCGHCFALYWEEEECVEHLMMMHMQTLTCPVDHLEFKGNRGLTQFCQHMKNKHPEMFPNITFLCTYCKTEFASIFEKLSHMKTCCEKKLICDVCGKRFFNKVKLALHLRIEKGILRYSCNVCGKNNFKNSMDLKLHVLGTHTTKRNFSCTFCDKTFKNSAARSSHMENHSGTSIKCHLCNRVFKKRVMLARHLKTMHNEADNDFSCQLCKKSFIRRENFTQHLKIAHNIVEEEQEL